MRFCGFRPSNRRLLFLCLSFCLPHDPLSLSLFLAPHIDALSTGSYCYARAQASSISRRAAVYDSLNDSDAFLRARLHFVSGASIPSASFNFLADEARTVIVITHARVIVTIVHETRESLEPKGRQNGIKREGEKKKKRPKSAKSAKGKNECVITPICR